ncbi:MAG: hypothetical protein Q4A65_09305, partial [Bacillota bacterium]|nr:hypothetical protein [Bacillota bacterium]
QFLHIELRNCKKEQASLPAGHLMCQYGGARTRYFHATAADGKYEHPARKTIPEDGLMIRQLARKRLLQQIERHLIREIQQLSKLHESVDNYSFKSLLHELPRAYRQLPEDYFEKNVGGWKQTKSGIVVPARLKQAALEGSLTEKQIEEIREIQREWAAQPYEINTKKRQQKKVITSTGLWVRSKSEGSIAEKLDIHDVPFRHDQLIRVGQKTISPDFTFFSIIRGEVYWEHSGKTNDPGYIDHRRYKQRLYENAGIVPWRNFIETFDEEEGYFDNRIIEAEINNKLLRWLCLK